MVTLEEWLQRIPPGTEEIWVKETKLTGSIPPALGNLLNLKRLWLDSHRLGGTIPHEIGGLIKLRELCLRNNLLTGSIPRELGLLRRLKVLLLDNNRLTGLVPEEVTSLKCVTVDIGNNYLTQGQNIPAKWQQKNAFQPISLDSDHQPPIIQNDPSTPIDTTAQLSAKDVLSALDLEEPKDVLSDVHLYLLDIIAFPTVDELERLTHFVDKSSQAIQSGHVFFLFYNIEVLCTEETDSIIRQAKKSLLEHLNLVDASLGNVVHVYAASVNDFLLGRRALRKQLSPQDHDILVKRVFGNDVDPLTVDWDASSQDLAQFIEASRYLKVAEKLRVKSISVAIERHRQAFETAHWSSYRVLYPSTDIGIDPDRAQFYLNSMVAGGSAEASQHRDKITRICQVVSKGINTAIECLPHDLEGALISFDDFSNNEQGSQGRLKTAIDTIQVRLYEFLRKHLVELHTEIDRLYDASVWAICKLASVSHDEVRQLQTRLDADSRKEHLGFPFFHVNRQARSSSDLFSLDHLMLDLKSTYQDYFLHVARLAQESLPEFYLQQCLKSGKVSIFAGPVDPEVSTDQAEIPRDSESKLNVAEEHCNESLHTLHTILFPSFPTGGNSTDSGHQSALQPLNLKEVWKNILKDRQTGALDHLRGNKGILLCGDTGAGKSTSICALRGDTITRERGLFRSDQEDAKIGFGTRSCTRGAYGVDWNNMCFVDTPRPQWLTPGINWAVCGPSGAGKSTLINRLRGLSAGDPGAAAVGVTETTVEPQCFPFPGSDNLKLWDIPGGGTVKFPADKYVIELGLRHMSGVILVTSTRASELDVQILTLLNHYNVPWYYVRTKVDLDIMNNEEDHGTPADETVKLIRDDLVRNMKSVPNAEKLSPARVFVISSRPRETHGHWREFGACIRRDLEISYDL